MNKIDFSKPFTTTTASPGMTFSLIKTEDPLYDPYPYKVKSSNSSRPIGFNEYGQSEPDSFHSSYQLVNIAGLQDEPVGFNETDDLLSTRSTVNMVYHLKDCYLSETGLRCLGPGVPVLENGEIHMSKHDSSEKEGRFTGLYRWTPEQKLREWPGLLPDDDSMAVYTSGSYQSTLLVDQEHQLSVTSYTTKDIAEGETPLLSCRPEDTAAFLGELTAVIAKYHERTLTKEEELTTL